MLINTAGALSLATDAKDPALSSTAAAKRTDSVQDKATIQSRTPTHPLPPVLPAVLPGVGQSPARSSGHLCPEKPRLQGGSTSVSLQSMD